jgi:hypothetical protein
MKMNDNVISIESVSSKPDKNSPCGLLMKKIMEKCPSISFDEARREAHRLLEIAAGRRNYRVPAPQTPEERATEKARLRTAFGKSVKDAA